MSITSRHTASSHVHDKARSFPETYLALPRRYRACSSFRGVKQGQRVPNRAQHHWQPHSHIAVFVSVETERLTRRRYQGLFILAANRVCSLLAEQDETARRKWYVFRFLLPSRSLKESESWRLLRTKRRIRTRQERPSVEPLWFL